MTTAGDPPDRDPDTDAEHKGKPDEPDRLDIDATFAAIVANWGDEPAAAWPTPEEAAEARRHYEDEDPDAAPSPGRMRGSEWGNDWEFAGDEPVPSGAGARGPLDEYDPDDLPEELRSAGPRDYSPTAEPEPQGYEPPEPPPLPRGDLIGRLAWAAVIGGPLFMLMSVLIWRPPQLFILIALAAFAGGFVTLVARMPKHRDDEDDDGAVI
ncbi:hypothetical protein [Kineosporia babensis]|uniref:DUF308 domain-containing protein n=1 Tax=Kineosporia babensis TaxID=499548 RepID=A0A9X1SYZ5_9ACTN|nr:hypothetical protein [Kineosporia babensis]MCD5311518.1 hypothetical protein [Kineosporia babensis]